jgi:hypothetical protein
MKVFVSTKVGQGMRENDFSFVPEGELVMFGSRCDGGSVDDECGCSRSLVGMSSLKATTTFMVVEKDITKEQYLDSLRKSFTRSGWAKVMGKKGLDDHIKAMGGELLRMASGLKAGFVYEIRGNRILARASADELRSVVEYNPPIPPPRKTRKAPRKTRKTSGISSQVKGIRR